jgi:hypothetical protein
VWPDVLYLQLDNTTKDNKNRALLTYLDKIVKIGVLKKAKVGFLYVGHTHEDIDQRFSVISRHLKQHDVLTMEAFLQVLRKLNTGGKEKEVTARTLDWMYDFSPWALDVVDKRFEKFTKHHVFRFKKVKVPLNENGQQVEEDDVRMHVKEWARKEEGKSFPYFPDLVNHRSYGVKMVNHDHSKGGIARYEERNKIGIAPFEGKLDRAGADAKLRNVKSLATGARKTWEVPAGQGVEMSPLVQEWELYLAMLPLATADVEYTPQRPEFFPWPKGVSITPRVEMRPDIAVEGAPLRNPIQASRVEGQGRVVVVGPVTGQGLNNAASEHAIAVAAATGARLNVRAPHAVVAPREEGMVEEAEQGEEAEEGEDGEEGEEGEDGEDGEEGGEEGGEEEGHDIDGVFEAMYKKSDDHRMFHVLWGDGTDTWEPELGTQTDNPQAGINPYHLYGECFDEPAGMKGRRIVFKFASGTSSNLRADENKDSDGKRKTALTCECIVKEVRDTEVVVAWEEVGVPVDEWDEDPQPLQLHTLEKGTEWKLLTFTGTREGQQVLYKRGLLQDLGRGNKRRRGGA